MKHWNFETGTSPSGSEKVPSPKSPGLANLLGVTHAVHNINEVIAPKLIAKNPDVKNQKLVDEFLLQLDGNTPNKCTFRYCRLLISS
jgi:enolase